jgi:hypothetical protein
METEVHRAKKRKALNTKSEAKRLRQGTEPKAEKDRRLSAMEWRRVIRSVDRREKGEEEIDSLAKALAAKCKVGDPNSTADIQYLYHEMSR